MVFSSLPFLFLFLPVVIILNWLLPTRVKNYSLLLASLFFYIWGEGVFVLLMLFSITLNYLIGRSLFFAKQRKIALVVGLAVNLLLLFYYKYITFFADVIGLKYQEVHLPIGVSFFTFQGVSYLIDVYRAPTLVQKSWVKLGLYISLFPQLVAGPIVRYYDVEKQLDNRSHNHDLFYSGIVRFISGLCKKVIIADTISQISDDIFGYTDYTDLPTSLAWLGLVCYSLQIYFDFSGYSDMAIGLGRMFGFKFLENFNYPYISKSISELWRRWHISLGNWFKDYDYIPLGGSRKGEFQTTINLSIVFLLTGLWHGASWNFLIWGCWHGLFVVLEKGLLHRFLRKSSFAVFYTLFVLLI